MTKHLFTKHAIFKGIILTSCLTPLAFLTGCTIVKEVIALKEEGYVSGTERGSGNEPLYWPNSAIKRHTICCKRKKSRI